MAENFIATAAVNDANVGAQTLACHKRCQVVFHLSVDSLKAEHEHSENCDCSLYTVMEDKYSNVLNMAEKPERLALP
jgi:hypothetical protein